MYMYNVNLMKERVRIYIYYTVTPTYPFVSIYLSTMAQDLAREDSPRVDVLAHSSGKLGCVCVCADFRHLAKQALG